MRSTPYIPFELFLTLPLTKIFSGHTHIDILKIDIEGWEFETITTLLTPYITSGRPLPFGQLQLEIHIWGKSFTEFLEWWETLEAAGLRPFWTEVGVECVHMDLKYITLTRTPSQPNLVYQNYNKRTNTAELAEVRYSIPFYTYHLSYFPALQYSFLNIKGDNVFIKDPKPLHDDADSEARHPNGSP